MEESKMDLLIKLQKKQLWVGRIRLIIAVLAAVCLVFAGVFLFRESAKIQKTNEALRTAVEALDMEEVNRAISTLQAAVEKVDVAELNRTLKALEGASDTLSKIDAEHLNSLIESLNNASGGLNDIIGVFKKLFGK